MPVLGYIVSFLAFLSAVTALIALSYGAYKQDEKYINVGRRSLHAVFFLVVTASVILIMLFLARDFSVKYVANYSSRDLPLIYTIAAFWAGQSGSLLFWELMLAIYTVIVLWRYQENYKYTPIVAAIMAGVNVFFTFIITFLSNPFETLDFVPADGQGLNPLLQNMGIWLHPTTQYLGYVGWTVPFAFAMAALLKNQADDEWIRKTRIWTIVTWLFLTGGIVWGGQWAYVELGWGGYFAWDPVENASIMPWATSTALLHSVMIQERKDMLKVWNVSLIALTFFFSILGTFLTRSGVLVSVHDFAEGPLGRYFIAFMALIVIFAAYLIIDRAHQLRSENAFEGLLAKESSFLVNNILFLGIAFATLWGTMFPIISEAVTGERPTVGPPFFNRVNGPIFLSVLLLMGICPLIAWRKSTASHLGRNLLIPGIISIIALIGFLLGLGRIGVAVAYAVVLFVASSIFYDLFKEVRVRRGYHPEEGLLKAIWSMMRIRSRKYGGYIVHLGVILMAVGIVGSTAYKAESTFTLSEGQRASFAGFELEYQNLSTEHQGRQTIVSGNLIVYKDGKVYAKLSPAKVFHGEEQPHSEVDIAQAGFDDLYAILAGFETGKFATFKMLYNPLVDLVWLGFYVMLLGGAFAIGGSWRLRRAARAAVLQPVPAAAAIAPQPQREG